MSPERLSSPAGQVDLTVRYDLCLQWRGEGSGARQRSGPSGLGGRQSGYARFVPVLVQLFTSSLNLCGFGIVPWSVGYTAQGNEFSYFMLVASFVIINWSAPIPNPRLGSLFRASDSNHVCSALLLRDLTGMTVWFSLLQH